jgi:acyl-CoA synthetase (AMP-forming)/AMP-acid ligase II
MISDKKSTCLTKSVKTESFQLLQNSDQSVNGSRIEEIAVRISEYVPARSLVLALVNNTMGSTLGLLAMLRAGIIPILIDAKTSLKIVNELIDKYHPSYLFTDQTQYQELNNDVAEIKIKDFVFIKQPTWEHFEVNDRLAMLLTTSGSTGSNKFVRISYENIYENAKSISSFLEIGPETKTITTLPLHYSFGFSILSSYYYSGAKIVLTERTLIEREFWQDFENFQVNSFSGVPYTFDLIFKLNLHTKYFDKITTITQAGGSLHPQSRKKLLELTELNRSRLYIMYGQTEATARMSYLDPSFGRIKSGSIGKAIPGGELFIVDEDGNKIKSHSSPGELCYTGKNVSLGYSESYKDLNKGDDNKGTLLTGDLGYVDKDGFYFITGRKKRFVKIAGHRINLDEIGNLCGNDFGEVVAIEKNNKIVLFVTSIDNRMKIKDKLSKQLNLPETFFETEVIKSLPRSKSGKILFSELEKNAN